MPAILRAVKRSWPRNAAMSSTSMGVSAMMRAACADAGALDADHEEDLIQRDAEEAEATSRGISRQDAASPSRGRRLSSPEEDGHEKQRRRR